MTHKITALLQQRFPAAAATEDTNNKTNSAITLYGRRFYKDQTPVEYLAELLLVFLSPKTKNGEYKDSFQLDLKDVGYYPVDHLALKLFSFYPTSKLETRHESHQKKYIEALELVKKNVLNGTSAQTEDTLRILQSFFSGFTGVAKNRTWVTYSFLPAAPSLISREIAWRHSEAKKNNPTDWESSLKYFDTGSHLFMARGGELLFLQLAHMFNLTNSEFSQLKIDTTHDYKHLKDVNPQELRVSLESALTCLLSGSLRKVEQLSSFIVKSLNDVSMNEGEDLSSKKATLGWVPTASATEAFLFATELKNICQSSLGELDKLEIMQNLCCLHVLRSLSFQAQRLANTEYTTAGFLGNYTWIISNPESSSDSSIRRLSQSSFESIENILYNALRIVHQQTRPNEVYKDNEADAHGFKIFHKISKEIGLVIPKKGQGQRFVLSPTLLRVLVTAVIKPGERVRLTEFYRRIFAHFGIAISNQQLSIAIQWSSLSNKNKDYAMTTESLWIEEALNQGGFLVELSDAVSIVHNPK